MQQLLDQDTPDTVRLTPTEATAVGVRALERVGYSGEDARIIVDQLLGRHRPPGYGVQTKSHNAVAAAVAQGRADWGIAIDTVARQYGLGFIPLQEEQYDFIVQKAHLARAAVRAFCALLQDPDTRAELSALGFRIAGK